MFTKRSALLVCLAMAALALPAALLAQTPACSVFVYPRFVAPNATTGTPGTGTPLAVYAALYPQAASLPDTYAVKFRGGDGLNRGLTWMPVGDFNPANADTGNWYADAATWLTATRQFYFTDASPRYFWVQGKVLNTSTAGPDTFRVRIRLLQPGNNYDSPVYEVTALDMAINGGWIEGNVYSDAGFTTPHQRHVVLAFKADTIASVYLTENNKIREGYDSTSAGYFRMAVPAGNIDSIQVRDTLNNLVASYVQTGPPWTISAGQATSVNLQDTIPPSIVWTSPAYGATDVGLSEPIVIAFSEPMDTASVTGYPSGNSFTISWNAASDTMTLTPQFAYQYGTLYWLIATAGTDLAGNSLPDLPDTVVYFTTIANQGPAITVVTHPGDTYDGAGPFLVRAVITDAGKSVVADTLWYTDNATNWWTITHSAVSGDTFDFSIPGPLAPGTVIEYFIGAWDDQGAVSYDPGMYRGHQFRILDPLPPSNLAAQAGDMMVELDWAPPAEVLDYSTSNVTGIFLEAGDAAVTRFTPQHYPCMLEQVVSSWWHAIGADSVVMHVWPDDGDGLPDMGSDLVTPRVIMPLDYPDYTVVDLSADSLVLTSGDFHVGYVIRTNDYPMPLCDGDGPGVRSLVYDQSAGTWSNLILSGNSYRDWTHQAAVTYSSHYTKGLALKSYRPKKNDKPLPKPAGLKAMPIADKRAPVYPTLTGALAMARNITGYQLFRGGNMGGPYNDLASVNTTFYLDTTVINEGFFYYVIQAVYATPDTVSAYSNEAGATPAAKPILLVNDAANSTEDAEAIYTAAIDGAGYSSQYTVYRVDVGNEGPSAAWFANRDAVVWWTGDDYETTLYPADEANLAAYLNGGGRLFLSADDYLYDVFGGSYATFSPGQFPYDYLGIDSVSQDFASEEDFTMAGVAGNFAEGQTFWVRNEYPQYIYADNLTKRAVAGTNDIFDVTAKIGEKPAIAYDNGTFRTVFFALPFENAQDDISPNTKTELMARILDWMTGVEGNPIAESKPTVFSLANNYPNPVRNSTTIKFGLPGESQVRVEVYNIAGQRVKSLVNGKLGAGYHQITWKGQSDNGQKVAAGVYLVRMSAKGGSASGGVTPEFSGTRKMTVIR